MCESAPNPKYRIIYHEVGHALQYMDFPITPENVLRKAVMPLARTQVDCLTWLGHTYLAGPYDMPRMWRDFLDPSPYEYIDENGQAMGQFMEKVRPSADLYHDEGQRRRYGTAHELWKQGVDIVDLASGAAHQQGLDFYLTFRLNDIHHGAWKEHPRWWLENKEFSIGRGELSYKDHSRRQLVCLDYTLDEVHEHMIAPMVAACECYDSDGLELDFTRIHPFFPPGQERPERLNAFVQKVHQHLAEVSRRKNRPLRLMAHLYNPTICASVGVDWQTWIREGWVDYLTPCGNEWNGDEGDLRVMVQAARGTRTRVYAAHDCISFMLNASARFGRIEYMRAACLNYYHQGVDGIYFFNGAGHWQTIYPGPVAAGQPDLIEVGDPDCIERRSKIYASGWSASGEPKLIWSSDPAKGAHGRQVAVTVSDRLQDSYDCGDLGQVLLRVEVRLVTPWINELNAWHCIWSRLDRMEYLLNGSPIEPRPIQQDTVVSDAPMPVDIDRNWTRILTFDLTQGPLPAYGRNVFSIRVLEPDPQLTGPRDLVLGLVELEVRYVTHEQCRYLRT